MDAQLDIGYLYSSGQGMDQDTSQAMMWYQKAADQGNATANHNIGCLYEHGEGVDSDFSKAATWYRKSGRRRVLGRKVENRRFGATKGMMVRVGKKRRLVSKLFKREKL
jgi:hypothetical protein